MLPQLHLIIPNDQALNLTVEALADVDCTTSTAKNRAAFWDSVRQPSDLLLIGMEALPKPIAESLQVVRALPHAPEVVVIVDSEDDEGRAKLLAAGCVAVVSMSIPKATLQATFAALVERRQAELENRIQLELGSESETRLSDFASTSPNMQLFMRTVKRVAPADTSLLILGETGVGKERLARAIHEASPRGERPFVPVNCAAFPESLLEGELFGHLRGAFTGATSDRRGCFEMADGGTIFLDEIGEVPRHVQVKLLRVLQERQIQRLGSEDLIPIDVRIMAATNRNLDQEIEARRFRRDLYYRLSVVTLEVPPLRDHVDDIPPLLDRYLDEFRITLRKVIRGFSPVAMQALCEYSWPGNVRELINVVERATLLCEADEITLADLPPEFGGKEDSISPSHHVQEDPGDSIQLPKNWAELPWSNLRPQVLSNLERVYIETHLQAVDGKIGQAAKNMGLSTRSLYLMMKRQDLRKEAFKPTKQ